MAELLDKISSYNLFNYLLPGVIFAFIASKMTHYSLLEHELVVAAFLYYFIGLVVSRFGSLVLEPIFKYVGFIKFADYEAFIAAAGKDSKLETLSEMNNTFRTLCSLFILLLFLKLYEKVESKCPVLEPYGPAVLVVLLLLTFAFAYRKQTEYVNKRIKATEK